MRSFRFRLAERVLGVLATGARVVQLGARFGLGACGFGDRAIDLAELAVERRTAGGRALLLIEGAREIFLGGHVSELALVRALARLVERGADLRQPRAQGVVLFDQLAGAPRQALHLFGQRAHLALLLDHGRGHVVAAAAADGAVRVYDRAVERHDRDAGVPA